VRPVLHTNRDHREWRYPCGNHHHVECQCWRIGSTVFVDRDGSGRLRVESAFVRTERFGSGKPSSRRVRRREIGVWRNLSSGGRVRDGQKGDNRFGTYGGILQWILDGETARHEKGIRRSSR